MALAIAGLIVIFGAFFIGGWRGGWGQAVLVNIGTALLLIPPLVVTERLMLSDEVEEVRNQVEVVRNDLEERLGALRDTVAQYLRIREDLPPSPERTLRLLRNFDVAKEQAKDTNIDAEAARKLFIKPGSQGDRLAVLAIAQVKQQPEFFPLVIDAIEHSETAFEQARALDTAAVLIPKLNKAQMQRLLDVINDQRSEGKNKWISPKTEHRWDVSEWILNELSKFIPGSDNRLVKPD